MLFFKVLVVFLYCKTIRASFFKKYWNLIKNKKPSKNLKENIPKKGLEGVQDFSVSDKNLGKQPMEIDDSDEYEKDFEHKTSYKPLKDNSSSSGYHDCKTLKYPAGRYLTLDPILIEITKSEEILFTNENDGNTDDPEIVNPKEITMLTNKNDDDDTYTDNPQIIKPEENILFTHEDSNFKKNPLKRSQSYKGNMLYSNTLRQKEPLESDFNLKINTGLSRISSFKPQSDFKINNNQTNEDKGKVLSYNTLPLRPKKPLRSDIYLNRNTGLSRVSFLKPQSNLIMNNNQTNENRENMLSYNTLPLRRKKLLECDINLKRDTGLSRVSFLKSQSDLIMNNNQISEEKTNFCSQQSLLKNKSDEKSSVDDTKKDTKIVLGKQENENFETKLRQNLIFRRSSLKFKNRDEIHKWAKSIESKLSINT
ncbi:hypothetical protein GVAV_002210 [Gurleya vavrai]